MFFWGGKFLFSGGGEITSLQITLHCNVPYFIFSGGNFRFWGGNFPPPRRCLDKTLGEAHWTAFKASTIKVVENVVGFPTRRHQDWFDENDNEISALLEQKNAAYRAWLSYPLSERKHVTFKNLRLKAQTELRRMQNNWWTNKAAELQQFFEENDSKSFFNALKEVYGPTAPARSPLRSADGECLLTDDGAVMDRWREHFQELLNRPSSADPDVVTKIPQRPVVHAMDNPPTVDEIRKAIAHLRSGKAPGQDGIPPEIYKVAETTITPRLHALFTQLWAEGEVSQDFKDAQITCIYKKKGDRSDCNNYRGISLLSIAGKILARVLLERLKLHHRRQYLRVTNGFQKPPRYH